MMNLAELKAATQSSASRDARRHQRSETLYQEGKTWVQRAVAEPHAAKGYLIKAGECFTQGIQNNRRYAPHFAGMGYLFFVAQDYNNAQLFFKQALAIDAQNELAKDLLQAIQEGDIHNAEPEAARGSSAVNVEAEEVDYDALYDAVEAQIFACVKQVMADEVRQIQPSLDVQKYQLLKTKIQRFDALLSEIQNKIEVVDEEIDTTDLKSHLAPMERVISQIHSLKGIFKQYLTVAKDIQSYEAQTTQIAGEMVATNDPNDLPILEENLEALLDHCDALADQLDAFDEKGYSIKPLEPSYNGYVKELEHYQEVLDDTRQRLEGGL